MTTSAAVRRFAFSIWSRMESRARRPSAQDQRRQQSIIEKLRGPMVRSWKPVMFISSSSGAHDHVVAL
jgi:hypothetical protein